MNKRSKNKKILIKIGNKGFTLIELLAVVAILAIIASIVIYFSLKIVNNANEKSYAATINNIEDDANEYILETGKSNTWMPTGVGDNQYQCVTVQDLIDIGYFKGDVLESKVDKNTYVQKGDYIYIERNKNNTITKSVLLVGDNADSGYLDLCGRRPTVATYTVSYDANGGSGAPASQTKTKDVDLTLSDVKPNRNDYEFIKWNTKKDGTGISYNPGDVYDTNLSITLFAQWEDNRLYTISYDANGGSGAPASQSKKHDVNLNLSNDKPTKTDSRFVSWNTKKDGTGISYNPGDVYVDNLSITLFAQWDNRKIYTITYVKVEGLAPGAETKKYCKKAIGSVSGEMEQSQCIEGEKCVLSKNKFSRADLNFVGWTTTKYDFNSKTKPSVKYTDEQVILNGLKNDIVLYTVWKSNHEWDATSLGISLINNFGNEKFGCGHYHNVAYTNYCPYCHMSVSHYNICYCPAYEAKTGTLHCPVSIESFIPNLLDDNELSNKNIENAKYWGGTIEGNEKLKVINKSEFVSAGKH